VSVPLLFGRLQAVNYGHYVAVIALVTIVQGFTDVGLGRSACASSRPASVRTASV